MSLRELIGLKLKARRKLREFRAALDAAANPERAAAASPSPLHSLGASVAARTARGTWSGEILRVLVGAACLHAVGFVFFVTTSLKYAVVPRTAGVFVGLGVHVVLAAVLFLPLLRAVTLLALPSLLTGRLRAALMILVMSWAFQVPASNIVANIRNTAEGVACVQERIRQSADETREIAGANLKKITQERFDEFARVAYRPFVEMRDTLRRVDDSVTRMIAWQKRMYKSVREMFDSCEKFMRLPFERCTTLVDSMYFDCVDATFDVLCLPIRILHAICHSTLVLQLHCEWPGALKKQLEESVGPYTKEALRQSLEAARDTNAYRLYASAKDKVNATIDSARSIEMEVNYTHTADTDVNLNVAEIKRHLREEIAAFEWFAHAVSACLDALMWPIVLSPLLSAVVYVARFNLGESVDNFYVNARFEAIDARRQAAGQSTVLPLLPVERKRFIRTTNAHITAKERRWMILGFALTILGAVVPLMFALADVACYQLTIKTFGFFRSNLTRIDPPNMYEMNVAGEGFMAELLSNLLDLFAPFSASKRGDLWRGCFEEPTPPDYALFQLMFCVFLFCLFLSFVQVYALRTRHLIALHYFPERNHPRAVHLYNEVLRSRKNVLDELMQRRSMTPADLEVADEADVHKCARCDRADLTLKNASNTRVCIRCNALYCVDCFTIRRLCIVCRASLQKLEESLELYVDSSCSDAEDEPHEQQTGTTAPLNQKP